MLAHVFLWLLVGLAAASNPGWRENKEYIYKIDSRTLTSLDSISSKHTGFIYKAEIRLQPRTDGKLQAQITRAEYSSVLAEMSEGGEAYIPEDQLEWKPLKLSFKPFQIAMSNGKINELVLNKNTPNWEANMIKGIVSQFQLNTNANDLIQSNLNNLPQGHESALFKTMEDTVTGNTETLYTIKRLPEHIVHIAPWYRVEKFQEGEEQVLEVVKHKNYTNNEELPSYFYGFGGMEIGEPGANRMADSIVRSSDSHAIITGNLNRYTLQHCITTSKIIVRPTLQDQQVGQVLSRVNVTLKEVRPKSGEIEEVNEPLPLTNLVYSYEQHPFAESNLVRERRTLDTMRKTKMMDMDMRTNTMNMIRTRRSLEEEQFENPEESDKYYHQDRPSLNEAPESPLLPYTMGYKGQSIKKSINVAKSIETLAKEIGQAMQEPEQVVQEEILSKFVTMTSLIRLMDSNELHQIAGQLYTRSEDQIKRDVWAAFRDGVAESGTGPALLVIKDWVEQNKIQGQEASQVLSAFANSVRHPTLELMQTYFELVKSSPCQSQWPLNDTALLSYTNLVRKVFIDREHSRKNYPINSFGRFDSREGLQFVKDRVIPYLSNELKSAIQNGENHKIHTLILSLGNVAHPQILAVFEPYLEGDKQVSQFQRFLMVVGMEKLAEIHPKEAKRVLFKIYQNSGEHQEIRAAAVYQLMKTRPGAEVFQLLASNTQTDRHEHVNAVVKSVIESVAQMEDDEEMRRAAESARPLLTKKHYGIQFGNSYIREYLNKEMRQHYQEQLETIGSKDSLIPKGFSYKWSEKVGGIHQKYVTARAMVNSVQEFTRVLQQQTESYKKMQQQQQQHFEKQQQNPLSSQSIARLLNLKPEEREQLEGLLDVEFAESMFFMPFDNQTIKNIPEVIRKYEQLLKNELQIRHTRFIDNHEFVLSLPTESGVPFLYTLHNPTAYKIEGTIKAEANPSMYQQGSLQVPKTIRIKSELSVTVTKKTQGQVSFVTPFDHQQYMTGFDKQYQIHLPFHGQQEIDFENQQVKLEFEVKEKHSGAHLFQARTIPYITRFDITDFKPVLRKQQTQEIRNENIHGYKTVFGKKETGLALEVNYAHERQSLDSFTILKNIWNKNFWSNAKLAWEDEKVQWSRLSLKYLPESSSTKKIVIRLKYQNKNFENAEEYNGEKLHKSEDPSERQHKIMKKIAAGLQNVEVQAVDASIEFQGRQTIQHVLSGANAVRRDSPALQKWAVWYQKKSENSPFVASFESKSETPMTHSMDVKYSVEHQEPRIDSELELSFGTHDLDSKIQAKVEMRRSQERKQYLKAQPEYLQALYELREGNSQLPAGLNVTLNAGLLDMINARVKFENCPPEVKSALKNLYQILTYKYWPTMEFEGQHQNIMSSQELQLEAKFHPDLKYVNVTLKSENEKASLKNIFVPEIAEKMFVLHPFFALNSRLQKYLTKLPTYRPVCVVDQTKVNNFNNRTFSAEISEHWTVMLQHVPKMARQQNEPETVEEQLKRQLENYVVLVRKNKQNPSKKDVKIVFSAPETQYETVDVTLTPQESSNIRAKVQMNERTVDIQPKETLQFFKGYAQMLPMDNGEVLFSIGDLFYVNYDGQRVRFSAFNGKLKNNVRGICGQFNDEKTEDLLTSENCIARDVREFVKSFEVEGAEGQRLRQEFSAETKKCVPRQLPLYVNVIDSSIERRSGSCTRFQTRYVEQNGEICFTVRPMPACGSACQEVGTATKSVPVHCIQKSNAALLWKKQIDQGGNPDFSHKPETRTASLPVPQSCVPY